MKKIIENYAKPTPKRWRKAGDFALLAVMVVEAQLATIPDVEIPNFGLYKWALTSVLIMFKMWTNTRVDENIYEGKAL